MRAAKRPEKPAHRAGAGELACKPDSVSWAFAARSCVDSRTNPHVRALAALVAESSRKFCCVPTAYWLRTGEASANAAPRGPRRVAAKSVGVTDVGVHTLRHSAAVAWLESGVHIKGSGRPARALLGRDHGRRVRAHVRRRRPHGHQPDPACGPANRKGAKMGVRPMSRHSSRAETTPDLRRADSVGLTCVGLTGFEPATT